MILMAASPRILKKLGLGKNSIPITWWIAYVCWVFAYLAMCFFNTEDKELFITSEALEFNIVGSVVALVLYLTGIAANLSKYIAANGSKLKERRARKKLEKEANRKAKEAPKMPDVKDLFRLTDL